MEDGDLRRINDGAEGLFRSMQTISQVFEQCAGDFLASVRPMVDNEASTKPATPHRHNQRTVQ